MRFHSVMAAMAHNINHTNQFAQRMGWGSSRAGITLRAYASGAYFPVGDELRAICDTDILLWAYKVALNAYHINKIIEEGGAQRLYAILQKATVDKWRVGNAMPSGRSKTKIEHEFGVSLETVPPECIYEFVIPKSELIRFDSRQGVLWVDNFRSRLTQIAENKFVIDHEAMQLGFVEAARNAGLEFVECGDFMRAEPASKVYIYYAKT